MHLIFEKFTLSVCVIFKSLCTEVYIYWANYYMQIVQFGTKMKTSNWTVNNSQTCRKWSKLFNCSNSECPSNDEFCNLNCSLWNFHNFAYPFPVHSWSLQEKLYWRENRITLYSYTRLYSSLQQKVSLTLEIYFQAITPHHT